MSLRLVTCAAVCSAAALSACVVAPARPYAYGPPPGEIVVADVGPPSPYVETIGVAPYPGAVWVAGYWGWRGGRHAWVGGHWEQARPGYVWHPHRWTQRDGRWHLQGGVWIRG